MCNSFNFKRLNKASLKLLKPSSCTPFLLESAIFTYVIKIRNLINRIIYEEMLKTNDSSLSNLCNAYAIMTSP